VVNKRMPTHLSRHTRQTNIEIHSRCSGLCYQTACRCRQKRTIATPTHCANNWKWNWDKSWFVWSRLRRRRSGRARNSPRNYRPGSDTAPSLTARLNSYMVFYVECNEVVN